MFFINAKRFFKTPVLISLAVAWTAYYIYGLAAADYTEFLQVPARILQTVQTSFLFFMFISYIFQSKSRQVCLDENISGIPHGMLRQVLSQFVFLMLFAVLVSSGTYIYMYCQTDKFQLADTALALFLAKLVIIHQFLPHLLAILLGLAVSGMKSEAGAYCVLVGFYMLFHVKTISLIAEMLIGTDGWMKRLAGFINLYSQHYGGMNNHYYIFSVENVNFQRIGAWLGIITAVILLQKFPRKKKWFSLLLFAAGAGCLGMYLMPSSELCLGTGENDFWNGDFIHYMYADADTVRNLEADFKLTSMQADFTADRLLDAEVTYGVDKKDLGQYCFTLYHGYRIKEIQNQNGDKLEFDQDNDYLTVKSRGKEVTALTFTYSGSNPHCYSTSQGIFLPAYLEYYPVPGFHPVYIQTPGYYGYTMEGFGYDVACQVTVHTKQTVYSNLPSAGKNCFKGTGDGISLYAGDFMKETTIGDCTVLYSPLNAERTAVESNPKKYLDFIQWYEKQSGDRLTLWCLPAGGNPEYYFGKGQLMGDTGNLRYYYESYQDTGDWYQTLSEEQLKEVEQMQEELEKMEEEENDRD